MAKIIDIDGHRFEIPDDEYTGSQLQAKARMDGDAVPVIRRGSKDIPVEPGEKVNLEPEDSVIFTTPVESAMDLKNILFMPVGDLLSFRKNRNLPSARLVIREEDYKSMTCHLLRKDGLERVSFILFGIRQENGIEEAFVHKVLNIHDRDYSVQTTTHVVPTILSQLAVFRDFSDCEIAGLMHVHSHPFSGCANFSHTDKISVSKTVRSLRDYLTAGDNSMQFLYGTMVIGSDKSGFTGCIYDDKSVVKAELSDIKIIGLNGIRTLRSHCHAKKQDTDLADTELLDRNIRWLGKDGQKRLSSTSLVICGVGGAGSMVALNARGLGFKKITLIDGDKIEKSNLNRLPAATLGDVNKHKVNVIKQMINDVAPMTEVIAVPEHASCDTGHTRSLIAEADIIVAAVDSFEVRFDLQWLAARYIKPLIDIGCGITLDSKTSAVKFMGGQVASYVPEGPCLCCKAVIPRDIESTISREIRKASGYVKGTAITPTAVMTINSIMAGYAMDMIIKYVTGFSEIKSYLKCDLMNASNQTFNFEKKSHCPICGIDGVEGKGDDLHLKLDMKKEHLGNKVSYEEVIKEGEMR